MARPAFLGLYRWLQNTMLRKGKPISNKQSAWHQAPSSYTPWRMQRRAGRGDVSRRRRHGLKINIETSLPLRERALRKPFWQSDNNQPCQQASLTGKGFERPWPLSSTRGVPLLNETSREPRPTRCRSRHGSSSFRGRLVVNWTCTSCLASLEM